MCLLVLFGVTNYCIGTWAASAILRLDAGDCKKKEKVSSMAEEISTSFFADINSPENIPQVAENLPLSEKKTSVKITWCKNRSTLFLPLPG